ncbi:hypothetical protein MAPG_02700 [Magnaporthiopsis poae ATCC 64411]|uniref:Uncharacterized protein n=1 Tax=Magnaporthiopsis poae (strain ATCC 64411 / 73-15) TaxID=644358 RepID=A0A0C4DS27_MAGP6|nr:hypothetical protein MAPG_02700 [Magnaporthiopsis poae ATCC 64411]
MRWFVHTGAQPGGVECSLFLRALKKHGRTDDMLASPAWLRDGGREGHVYPAQTAVVILRGKTIRWTTPRSILRGWADYPGCRQIAGGERRGRAKGRRPGNSLSHNAATRPALAKRSDKGTRKQRQ